MKRQDKALEGLFGPPAVAAADLHELRIWGQGRTALTPTGASAIGRELCTKIDPTWPARALTNERVTVPHGSRPRGFGFHVQVGESTIENLVTVAEGRNPRSTTRRSAKNFETLWPAQNSSWMTWVMQSMDMRQAAGHLDEERELRSHGGELTPAYLHPAKFMVMVRSGGTPYLEEVKALMDFPFSGLKFASITLEMESMWTRGLSGFKREWLDHFPDGDLALWLRSSVCNGWFTSHQLAQYMGLDTARSCQNGWI